MHKGFSELKWFANIGSQVFVFSACTPNVSRIQFKMIEIIISLLVVCYFIWPVQPIFLSVKLHAVEAFKADKE